MDKEKAKAEIDYFKFKQNCFAYKQKLSFTILVISIIVFLVLRITKILPRNPLQKLIIEGVLYLVILAIALVFLFSTIDKHNAEKHIKKRHLKLIKATELDEAYN
jgi:Na+/melibiose symporter-like transporter